MIPRIMNIIKSYIVRYLNVESYYRTRETLLSDKQLLEQQRGYPIDIHALSLLGAFPSAGLICRKAAREMRTIRPRRLILPIGDMAVPIVNADKSRGR